MKSMFRTMVWAAAACQVVAATGAQAAGDITANALRYEVTITNVSKLRFTPLLVVTHTADIALTAPGAAPSDALAEMAEGGSLAGLTALLDGVPDHVGGYGASQGLLEPGHSVTVEVSARNKRFDRISVVAMVLPSNDSFVWLDGASAPRGNGASLRYMSAAWDAGSEPNDEACANIPGPPCMGIGTSPDAGGEGYVTVSAGIQGIGDVASASYDWRNPVASIRITRID